ncbi:MAG: diguanylate cyclase [Butyrivibrio sp.]|nr:diguanylate cyclase [Muribaculum sp.]MCM1551338.1 diguanylate cyclase [Butyrivibrio sp.]
MRHILVVDDDKFNLVIATNTLSDGYAVSTAGSGEEALLWLESHSADMILMDIEMKGMNGIETVKLIKEDARWSHIPIIFLTATSESKVESECLQTGADDFITKPFVPMVMKSRVDRIMELYDLRYGLERELLKKTKQVEMVTMHSIMSIANTIDAKDKYTSGHSIRVAKCSMAIARELGWTEEEQQNIQYVALLHDIGKIGIPDAVLNKPSHLTEEEFAMIKKHPVIGGEILKEIHTIPHVREGALFHHERYDGKGYPHGLKGRDIPLFGRIVCIADTYDAMSTDRVYRKRLPDEKIISEYEKYKGTQFDPYLTNLFVRMLKNGYTVDNDNAPETKRSESSILLDSVLKECMEEAANISMTDTLTGLYNKAYAQSHVEELLRSNHGGALFMMDMDDFKRINDVYGHIIGDQVLKIYAGVMRKASTGADILCRVGGDEFIMFNTDVETREAAEERARKIIETLAEDVKELNMLTEVSTSVGIVFAKPEDDFVSLCKKADKALYFTKRNGKNSYHFFEDHEKEQEDSANNVDINNIRNIIQGRMDFSKGAFHLAYGEFQKVYNFIARYMGRGTQDVQIVLMTVKSRKMYLSEFSGQEEVMAELEKAISTTLRSSDVYTRYSSSQYIVILMDANEENGKMVAERILTSFHKMQKNDAFVVQSDICKMD